MRLKYFVEYSDNWSPGGMSKADIPKLPIAYALAGFPLGDVVIRNRFTGHNGKQGILFVPEGKLDEKYDPKSDDWFEIPVLDDKVRNVRCFFGYPKGMDKPKPLDFVRGDVPIGEEGIRHPLKYWLASAGQPFADGNIWEVPVARRFDFGKADEQFQLHKRLDKLIDLFQKNVDGGVQSVPEELLPPEYEPTFESIQHYVDGKWVADAPPVQMRDVWELALRIDRLLNGTQSETEKSETPNVSDDTVKNWAVRILQEFYNIGVAEAGWLGMFTNETFLYVITRFCGYDHYMAWSQKKIRDAMKQWALERITTSQQNPSSNSGATDETTDTAQP